MKRKKKHFLRRSALIALLLSCALSGGTALAATVSVTSNVVTNNMQIGTVNIALTEYQKNADGKESTYVDNKSVVPGEQISKIPRIKNNGIPCYIRVKVTYTAQNNDKVAMTDSNLMGLNSNFVKVGEYFYYKNILEHGSSVDLFTGVTIPKDAKANGTFKVGITAEAIQARNISPDYSIQNPWGNVTVEDAKDIDENTYKTLKAAKSNVSLSVTMTDDSRQLVAMPEDFFEQFGYLVPGDTLERTVDLNNNYTWDSIDLYFQSKVVEKDNDLLNKVKLLITLTQDGNTSKVYDGSLNADFKQKLATIKGKASAKLTFKITVPAELGNAYAMTKGKVQWIFSCDYKDKPTSGQESSDNSSGGVSTAANTGTPATTPAATPTVTPAVSKIIAGAKTWDSTQNIIVYYLIFAASAAGAVYLIRKERKEVRNTENRHEKNRE